MKISLSTELSEHEIYLIGSVVSQWGFLESDIFNQTLLSFMESENIPTSMNNAQFSSVLKLWLERVVERQDDATKAILKAQYDEIVTLSEYRQAVVHSRCEWRPDAPDEITAVRAHKNILKHITFTADDLANFSSRLGQVRYWIKYPRGSEQHSAEISATGLHISRGGWKLLAGRTSSDDLSKSGEERRSRCSKSTIPLKQYPQ